MTCPLIFSYLGTDEAAPIPHRSRDFVIEFQADPQVSQRLQE